MKPNFMLPTEKSKNYQFSSKKNEFGEKQQQQQWSIPSSIPSPTVDNFFNCSLVLDCNARQDSIISIHITGSGGSTISPNNCIQFVVYILLKTSAECYYSFISFHAIAPTATTTTATKLFTLSYVLIADTFYITLPAATYILFNRCSSPSQPASHPPPIPHHIIQLVVFHLMVTFIRQFLQSAGKEFWCMGHGAFRDIYLGYWLIENRNRFNGGKELGDILKNGPTI